MDGGIFGLLGLIRDHRGAVEYDLSTRFGTRCPKGLRSVGETITLSELGRLVAILRNDPASAITAALQGWDYPIDRTTLAVLDLYDLTAIANSDSKKGRPKPHPARPMTPDTTKRRMMGNVGGRSREQVEAILERYARGAAV